MEFADIVIKRIEGENDSKKPVNVLICFAKKETGKALSDLTNKMIRNRPGASSITLLNLITKNQAERIEDENIYKSELFSDIITPGEADKTTVRTFVKHAENFAEEIIKTADEQNSNIIFFGIGHNIFNSSLWERYLNLKSDISIIGDEEYQKELGETATSALRSISLLLSRNEQSTGIFISNKYKRDMKRVFVPILKESDIFAIPYFYQLSKNQDINITVWDAIGIIESNSKLQKLFNSITRRSDGRVKMWDNDKKIKDDFIRKQELMIIGFDGWEKLISTPLTWLACMPSVLIIKDKRSI